ncbi:MAG TPA: fumarylacetoacetate hydrolase family protein [Capsulimonadaceae bacterium]|nr:fumarylacetoacetate hydrolase family protein [Capsulimonadaceae bacterium]
MKFVRFIGPAGGMPTQGVIFDGEVYDMAAIGRMYSGSAMAMIEGDLRDQNFAGAERRLRSFAEELTPDDRCPLAEAHLVAPVTPPSFRDFYAFEDHVKNARRRRGQEMVPDWYEAPVFYFSNTTGIVGPDAPVKKPAETSELDYELEIAVVIGRDGSDVPVQEADSYIAGFTILNDWSARDIQRREMKVGLGPAKGKDFATSVGPYLVTPDELEEFVLPDQSRGKRYDLTMTVSVNGIEYSRGNAKDMHWTFAELIAHASKNTRLLAGDLIGSGTVGGGCIVEYPEGTYPWLQAADEVTLAIDRLGELTNRVE